MVWTRFAFAASHSCVKNWFFSVVTDDSGHGNLQEWKNVTNFHDQWLAFFTMKEEVKENWVLFQHLARGMRSLCFPFFLPTSAIEGHLVLLYMRWASARALGSLTVFLRDGIFPRKDSVIDILCLKPLPLPQRRRAQFRMPAVKAVGSFKAAQLLSKEILACMKEIRSIDHV